MQPDLLPACHGGTCRQLHRLHLSYNFHGFDRVKDSSCMQQLPSSKPILPSVAGQQSCGHLDLARSAALCSCCGCSGGRWTHCLPAGASLLQLPHSTGSPPRPGLACRPLQLLLPPGRKVQPPPAYRCSPAEAPLSAQQPGLPRQVQPPLTTLACRCRCGPDTASLCSARPRLPT